MSIRTDSDDATRAMDDRGVSEVLSFILVFGMILSAVILVGLVGFDSIQDYQEVEQLGNAERAMDAFADNANDVVRYDGVERRAGELTLREGTVDPGAEGTVMNITSGGDELFSEDLGALTYETGSDTIAYEGGGVFRSTDDGASVVRSDPMVTCREDVALISLVTIEESDQTIRATDGVEFDIREEDSNRTVYDANSVTIEVEGGDENEAGWEMYFEHADGWDENGDGWECSDVERVSIDTVDVDINY